GPDSAAARPWGRPAPFGKQLRPLARAWLLRLAETEGFEPSMQVLPACSLSRGVPSTSRPRLLASRFLSMPARGALYPKPRGPPGPRKGFFQTISCSAPKALCSARTASSMYLSSMTAEVLIPERDILAMLD